MITNKFINNYHTYITNATKEKSRVISQTLDFFYVWWSVVVGNSYSHLKLHFYIYTNFFYSEIQKSETRIFEAFFIRISKTLNLKFQDFFYQIFKNRKSEISRIFQVKFWGFSRQISKNFGVKFQGNSKWNFKDFQGKISKNTGSK